MNRPARRPLSRGTTILLAVLRAYTIVSVCIVVVAFVRALQKQ